MMRGHTGKYSLCAGRGSCVGIGGVPGRTLFVNFDKQWKEDVDFDRFKPMASDKDFLQKLFPNGVPQ
jgi:hypothetical protein